MAFEYNWYGITDDIWKLDRYSPFECKASSVFQFIIINIVKNHKRLWSQKREKKKNVCAQNIG